MKHTDISKVKVGDLWVRGVRLPPAVVVKVNKDTIDLYLPEGTEGMAPFVLAPQSPEWVIRQHKALFEEMFDNDNFYFQS